MKYALDSVVLMKAANVINDKLVKYKHTSGIKKEILAAITEQKDAIKAEFPNYLKQQFVCQVIDLINNIISTIECNRKNKDNVQLCFDYWNRMVGIYSIMVD